MTSQPTQRPRFDPSHEFVPIIGDDGPTRCQRCSLQITDSRAMEECSRWPPRRP